MLGLPISPRRTLVIAHDLVMTAAAVIASFYIRFEAAGLMERETPLLLFLPGFVAYAGIVYYLFHLYEAKWRVALPPGLFENLPRLSRFRRFLVGGGFSVGAAHSRPPLLLRVIPKT